MSAYRERRHHAAMAVLQLADDITPQRAVHRESVKQDDHGAAAARVLVLDDPRRQLDLRHGYTSPRRLGFAERICSYRFESVQEIREFLERVGELFQPLLAHTLPQIGLYLRQPPGGRGDPST